MQNRDEWINLHLPKLLPEDAYNFVRALDEIIMACNGEQVFDSSSKVYIKIKFLRTDICGQN